MSDSESSVPTSQSVDVPELGNALPLQNVKTIIGTVPDVMPISQEALFAFSKATELFIGSLVKGVYQQYGASLDYDELAEFISENDEYSFLHDFFPRRLSLSDALERSNERLKE